WPVTDKNTLNFSVGMGYLAYVQHSELDRIFVTPASELSFDLYVGEFWINLHDRFSVLQNAYTDPTVTGAGNYALFQNAIGMTALWDLDKVKVNFGYDHATYETLTGNAGAQAITGSDLVSTSVARTLGAGRSLGLELSGGLTYLSGTNAPEATQWSV